MPYGYLVCYFIIQLVFILFFSSRHADSSIYASETCLSDIKKMEPIDGLNRVSKVSFCFIFSLPVLYFNCSLLISNWLKVLANEQSYPSYTHKRVCIYINVIPVCFIFNQDRWKLLCSICGVAYGACIQVISQFYPFVIYYCIDCFTL